ncbi:MAG TPA: SH3 domain-containing protein, partial [Geminicoccaceae bacterium]|nr:SH3 domain-containing protein [Geminicoccaceae bacterium]
MSFAAGVAFLLLAGAALAETGDALVVTGDGVNVRAGPSGDAAIRMRVHRNQQVIELQREGAWVRAEIAGMDGQEGWIHSSLLAPAAEEPAAAETEPPSPPPAAGAAAQDETPPLMIEPAAGADRDVGELARF